MSFDILFVVPYTPNLIRVRPYNLIKALSANGHRVHVVTLWSDEAERADVESLRSIADKVTAFSLPRWRSLLNCIQALPGGEPLQAAYCWHPQAAAELGELASSADAVAYDVVHIEHLRGVRYGLSLQDDRGTQSRNGTPPIVWDSVDSISHLFRQAAQKSKNRVSRWVTRLELARTEQHEGKFAGQFDRVLVTSTSDRDAFLGLPNADANAIQERVSVLSNGVDLEYFKPDKRNVRRDNVLIVSGKMSYHANVSMVLHLVERVMPLIWAKKADAELWIVGKDPAREIRAFENHPGIRITGTVPDLRPFLQQATVSLAPLTYGAGIQNKVLEAMASGTPVIAYPGVISALKVRPGQDLMVANSPEEMAVSAVNLLDNRELRRQLGSAGRVYVEKNHNWGKIAERLETIYTEVISARTSP